MNDGIGYSLLAALSLGIADLFIQKTSRAETSIKTLLYSQLVGVFILGVFLLISGSNLIMIAISVYGSITLFVGIILALGNIFLFRAFELGPILVVSPITSSFAIITVTLSLFFGEKPSFFQYVGLITTIGGIMISGIRRSTEQTNRDFNFLPEGIKNAFWAALLFGVGFWLLRFPSPVLGSVLTTFIARCSSIGTVVLIMAFKKYEFRIQKDVSLIPILLIGILNASGLIFYNYALIYGLTSIVSVIFSLYGVITVIIGYLLLKQRVSTIQYLGIVMTFIGVATLSLG